MGFRLSTGLRNAMMKDKGFKEAMDSGIIEVFTGPQPASADAAETGTKLLRITKDHAAFVGGNATNGLVFATDPTSGALSKNSDSWEGLGLVEGVAGWYRFYANAYGTGLSTTAVRFDGVCSGSGSQFRMSTTNIKVGVPVSIDTAVYTMPAGS